MSRLRRREAGAAAVEFALVAPLLIGLITGIVEFGFIWNKSATVDNVTTAAARQFASLNGSASAGSMQSSVTSFITSSIPAGARSVTVTYRLNGVASASARCPSTVTVPAGVVTVDVVAVYPTMTRMFANTWKATSSAVATCN